MEIRPRQAFVGIGGNLGDRRGTMESAIARLRSSPGILSAQSSSIYETDPIGEIAQPKFLNAVVGLETTLTPEVLLQTLKEIEREFGRLRLKRWGPRTLDLDLLAYEGESRSRPDLELPHPRMLERAFVVIPFRELMNRPDFARPEWHDLRTKLRLPIELQGVRLFAPGI